MKYADVIVDISLEAVDRVFQYRIPEELEEQIQVGASVMIPFGNGNRRIKGFVLNVTDQPDFDTDRMKEIEGLTPQATTAKSHMIRLAAWMRDTYGCTMNQALKTVVSVKRQVRGSTKRYYTLCVSEDEAAEALKKAEASERFASRALLLRELIRKRTLTSDQIRSLLPSGESVMQTLIRHGLVAKESREVFRMPYKDLEKTRESVELNGEQKKAVQDIWERRSGCVHLLHGVTGSGKTEVYMELIQKTLDEGRQAIVLIPEISLTYQTVRRLTGRFGRRVSVIHSRLSEGERYDQYRLAQEGEVDVVIGPRSALFTPFERLGLIIMDEEQDSAYKSETVPRYHAREVAIQRTLMENACLVLGSATPSLESYTRALEGIYGFHRLTCRAAGSGQMAQVEVVDLKKEFEEKNYSIFSRKLYQALKDCLDRKEQAMIFLNRRGYSGMVSCRQCGHVIQCPHCDVAMKLHRSKDKAWLACHYCGQTLPFPQRCPSCGSPYIGAFGTGTQKVEQMLKDAFPFARILRADQDTTRRKHGSEDVFEAFYKKEADILVGTQMIVKGHDFKDVTLVGILAADLSMFSGDYMAGERTFQLLTQAAGRAGRGDRPGQVIIQTYQPEHYAVTAAAKQDYEAFYKEEMAYRKMMAYPPVCRMMVWIVEDLDRERAESCIREFYRIGKELSDLAVLPPAPAAIAKERDRFRYVLYAKSPRLGRLIDFRKRCQEWLAQEKEYKDTSVTSDIHPMSVY
ncbi:MAG TPA: primosomal protein N' [Candidatus Onthocola gallistercoris]|uniref:Replication restart protein PriA n=1 Tax=Candidatus Onthocola gallistercoris TaxID=2840876 RepID=A0A9D1HDR4_9FIRM|nr:primosomal protein N' [Candidatus Onthocola gallistercoris]